MAFTTEQIQQIIDGYNIDYKSRNQLAREFGVADHKGTDNSFKILNALKANGVEIRSQAEAKALLQHEQYDAVRKTIEQTLGMSTEDACNRLSCREITDTSGLLYSTVRTFLQANNYQPRKTSQKAQNTRRGRKKVDDAILVQLYTVEQKTMKEVAEYFGITPGAVCLHCQRLGISRTTQEASALIRSKMTPDELAADFAFRSERSLRMIAASTQRYSHTDIECLFITWCETNVVTYQHQFRIPGVRHVYDFYLPDGNTVVEVDGDYWHTKPEQISKDVAANIAAQQAGFHIVRFLRSEIKKTKSKCFGALLPLVSQQGS
jgi:very-short-patch-repair endonuclease/transposase